MPRAFRRLYSWFWIIWFWIQEWMAPIMANSPAQMHLIRCAQAGDSEAFSSLYESHRRKVYSICLRITGEPSEAEDCAQEAFLQCFLQLSTFRRLGSVDLVAPADGKRGFDALALQPSSPHVG